MSPHNRKGDASEQRMRAWLTPALDLAGGSN
jgi:hypothetical protein